MTFGRGARLILQLSRQRIVSSDLDTIAEHIGAGTDGFDWALFLDQALQHRVGPLLSWSMDKVRRMGAGPRLDRTVADTLRTLRLHQVAVNEVLVGELAGLLSAAGTLRVVVRKGAHLAWHVYEDASIRPMSDIDLLVSPSDASAVSDLLTGAGFQQGRVDGRRIEPLPRRETVFWRMYGGDMPGFVKLYDRPFPDSISVDVNVTLGLPGASDYEVPVDELIDRARPRNCPAYTALLLEPEDVLLDLCLHTYKNATVLRFMRLTKHRRLLKYVDLAEFLAHDTTRLRWDVLLDRVDRYRARRPVLYTLAHLERLFPGTVPARVLDHLAGGTPDVGLFLDQYGQWDLPEPRRWATTFEERYFSRRYDAEIPRSRSLV